MPGLERAPGIFRVVGREEGRSAPLHDEKRLLVAGHFEGEGCVAGSGRAATRESCLAIAFLSLENPQ